MTPEAYSSKEMEFARAKRQGTIGFWVFIVWMPILSFYFRNDRGWETGMYTYLKLHWLSWLVMLLPMIMGARMYLLAIIKKYELYMEWQELPEFKAAAEELRLARRSTSRPRPAYFMFCRYPTLREFERAYVRFYREERSKAIKDRHIERAAEIESEREVKFRRELADLEKEFAEALALFDSERERSRFRKRARETKTRDAVKSLIREMRTEASTAAEASGRQEAKIASFRLTLEGLAAEGMCDEAKALGDEAEALGSPREKAELLKRAISAQQAFNRSRPALNEPRHAEKPAGKRPVYDVSDLLPREASPDMSKAILLCLAEGPCEPVRLKRRVAERYRAELRASFPLQVYEHTLEWLKNERIVTGESSLSMNRKPDLCATAAGAEIVRRTVEHAGEWHT